MGSNALAAHFPPAAVNPTTIVPAYPASVWNNLSQVASTEDDLGKQSVFHSVSGLLNPNGTSIQPAQLTQLHAQLGDPSKLQPIESTALAAQIPASSYNAYRATAQFVSPDGRTVQFYTTLTAGTPALRAIPAIRDAVAGVARAAEAIDSGVIGQAAAAFDVSSASNGANAAGAVHRRAPGPLELVAVGLGPRGARGGRGAGNRSRAVRVGLAGHGIRKARGTLAAWYHDTQSTSSGRNR